MSDIALSIRVLLVVVFLPSALGKLNNRVQFKQGVLDYAILPVPIARVFSALLPWMELFLSLTLVIGVTLRVVALIASLLLFSFIVALAINIRRQRILECHCYSIFGSTAVGWGTVIRDVMLVVLTITFFVIAPDPYTLNDWLMNWRHDLLVLLSIERLLPLGLIIAAYLTIMRLIEEGINLKNQFTRMDFNG